MRSGLYSKRVSDVNINMTSSQPHKEKALIVMQTKHCLLSTRNITAECDTRVFSTVEKKKKKGGLFTTTIMFLRLQI